MVRARLTLLVVSVALAAPLQGESQLIVKDGTGLVLGELIGINDFPTDLYRDSFLYRYGANEFVVMGVSREWGPERLSPYFDNSSCTGTPWFPTDGSILSYSAYPIGVIDNQLNLYRIERGASPGSPTLTHKVNGSGVCVSASAPSNPLAATEVGVFPFVVGPIRYDLNPTIFWDQFQTGDMSRWSNY